jgi:hypothetical protein
VVRPPLETLSSLDKPLLATPKLDSRLRPVSRLVTLPLETLPLETLPLETLPLETLPLETPNSPARLRLVSKPETHSKLSRVPLANRLVTLNSLASNLRPVLQANKLETHSKVPQLETLSKLRTVVPLSSALLLTRVPPALTHLS